MIPFIFQGEQESDMDEIEEDNGQDIIDPWGIVNKPLRVSFYSIIFFEVNEVINNKSLTYK